MESFKYNYKNNSNDDKNCDYYRVLGVGSNSTTQQIRRAYHKLAMRWHPDKWTTRCPSLLSEASRTFQHIQQAYSVLSDERKRTIYDAGLYDLDDEDEGFTDFLKEMATLMTQTRREKKMYSFEELQSMFMEMANGFGSKGSFLSSSCPKRRRTNVSNTNSFGFV